MVPSKSKTTAFRLGLQVILVFLDNRREAEGCAADLISDTIAGPDDEGALLELAELLRGQRREAMLGLVAELSVVVAERKRCLLIDNSSDLRHGGFPPGTLGIRIAKRNGLSNRE
jgi:hypothetical protein